MANVLQMGGGEEKKEKKAEGEGSLCRYIAGNMKGKGK